MLTIDPTHSASGGAIWLNRIHYDGGDTQELQSNDDLRI